MAIDYSEETEYLERLQDQLLQEAARLREQVEKSPCIQMSGRTASR